MFDVLGFMFGEHSFIENRTEVSRELLSEQRKKMLQSLLLVLTLIAGEDVPVDTSPETILPTAELKRLDDLSESPMVRDVQKRMDQERRLRI